MKYQEQKVEDFSTPERVYNDHELQDFHNKIQRFWEEPREVSETVFGKKIDGIAQRFAHQSLHVAFGAAIRVKHGKGYVYLYNSRYATFQSLWRQYEEYRKKQDWISEKKSEELEMVAQESVIF